MLGNGLVKSGRMAPAGRHLLVCVVARLPLLV
jgi:hypothetical protein